jgi:hypothetical protein
MRICTINGGSLKVFLRRDMHDVIIPQWGRPGSGASASAAAKCFTASVTETGYGYSIVSRFRSHAAVTGELRGGLQ